MSLTTIRRQIIGCQRCPRLRAYCARVAKDKRAAYRDEDYWGRPVPSFGDRRAKILVLGLAPGAHGANRTGRMFTGDRSGDFLMRAMFEVGFSNMPTSSSLKDGLKLQGVYISAVVHCAPPENKPNLREISACGSYLEDELNALPQIQVVVALGKIAFDTYWRTIAGPQLTPRPRPQFNHGLVFESDTLPALLTSYHPSQQNTNTGKLTLQMLTEVLTRAKSITTP